MYLSNGCATNVNSLASCMSAKQRPLVKTCLPHDHMNSSCCSGAKLVLVSVQDWLCCEQQRSSGKGVAGVEAEAELLAAMVMFFQRVGLSSKDVAIKISSRQLLQAVLDQHQVPADSTSRVFVTIDKMDKLPQETVRYLSAG